MSNFKRLTRIAHHYEALPPFEIHGFHFQDENGIQSWHIRCSNSLEGDESHDYWINGDRELIAAAAYFPSDPLGTVPAGAAEPTGHISERETSTVLEAIDKWEILEQRKAQPKPGR